MELARRRRRGRDPDGPQRHGQDHDGARHHGPAAARAAASSSSTARGSTTCPPSASPGSASAWCPRAARSSPTSRCARTWSPPPPTALGARQPVDARSARSSFFPRLGERQRNMRQPALGRRAADAGDRPGADDQPQAPDPRRGDRGLAPLIRQEIWSCLDRLKREGQAILVIDKNVGALIGLADRHHIVEKGRVVWTGTSQALAARQRAAAPLSRRLDGPLAIHRPAGMMRSCASGLSSRCLLLAAGPAFGQGQVNVYNWSDYIAEDQLKLFAKDTGIKVNYTTYDSNEILDAKLKTGRSGYDVVVPTASPFFVRQLAAKPLPAARQGQAQELGQPRPADHGVAGQVRSRQRPRHPLDVGHDRHRLQRRRDQEAHARCAGRSARAWCSIRRSCRSFADCGVMMLDSATDVLPAALNYLGLDPDSRSPRTSPRRPTSSRRCGPSSASSIPRSTSTRWPAANICLAFGFSGDILQARDRAAEAKDKRDIAYAIPKPGRDAVDRRRRHPQGRAPIPSNAHALPRLHDGAQGRRRLERRSRGYANANKAATALLRQVDLGQSADLSVGRQLRATSTPSPPAPPSRCASARGCGPRSRPGR